MPKRLRYTQVLGLNARGLTRHQKRQIVWKKHVKGKFNRSQYVKPTPQKRVNTINEYWDKYHDEQQRFDAIGLKLFLKNPSKILSVPQHQRKIKYEKLKNAQLRIEYLKYKYSVAIPDKKSLKLIATLAKGQGIIQMKTSNHCNGYWAHLLTQRNVSCKVFNAHNNKHLQLLSNSNSNTNNKMWQNKKIKKNKHKNVKKSKKLLAAEAKQWVKILNNDSTSKINDILKDYSQYVLLMVYPDFMMDNNIINEIMKQQNGINNENENENDNNNNNDKYRTFGHLIENNNETTFASVQCLKHYKGNYVIHIGELFGCTYDATNVWGKTTSMQFQIELQTHFHKVYQYEMCRWPMFRDTLTIWKRNKIVNVGNQQIISLQDIEINDSINTKYWQSVFKQRTEGKKGGKKNIFEGANYAANQ